MMDGVLTPSSEQEASELIASAAAKRQTIEILGGGTKAQIGAPLDTALQLSSSHISGIVAYEPTELVITAKAGTPLKDIEKALDKNNQMLVFEPMDYRALLGSTKGTPTIGAVAATNCAGPRRFVSGAARDSLLGVRFVNGKGEVIANGGRVMKNVTGLDLVKLMAGSWGTLGLLTEVVFKVLPKHETETTLIVHGLEDEDAVAAMARVMATAAEASGAAHLPELVSGSVIDGALKGTAITCFRVEGFEDSVKVRIAMLEAAIGKNADMSQLGAEQSRALWADIRDVKPFIDDGKRAVWRVSMAPSQAWQMVDRFRREAGCAVFYDWQGGLAYLRMEADVEAQMLRKAIKKFGGGHATLVRADIETRAANACFEPLSDPLMALSTRIKASFDPAGILNPGRMGL